MKLALLLSMSATLAACGGKPSATSGATAPTAPTAPAAPTALSPGAWEGMDGKARAGFMKHTVLPTMAAEFKAFDGETFAEFKCSTCHGPGAAEGKFDMPSGALPELDFANLDPDDAAIIDFMKKKVTPTMVTLLGTTQWSPDNPTGFGCLSCHTAAQ